MPTAFLTRHLRRPALAARRFFPLLGAVLLQAGAVSPLCAAQAAGDGGTRPQVRIAGIGGALEVNVRAGLRLASSSCDAPSWRVRRLFDEAESDIAEALRPFGHYTPRVSKTFTPGEGCWSASFEVDAGRRVHWRRVDVRLSGEAQADPAFDGLLDRLKPEVGAPLEHAAYERLKAELLLLAAARGYRDGRLLVHELRVDPEAGTAEALLHYDSGPRYRFGEIQLHQDVLDDDFVQRFIKLSPDDPYDAAAIGQLQRELMDSGLFSGVEVRPAYGPSHDRRVPVDVHLEPRKRHAYMVGLGLSTDEGARLRLGYENRRFNARGHSGEVALRLSPVRSNLTLGYNIPLADPAKERLSLQAGYQEEHVDDTDSTLYKLGARHISKRHGGLIQTLFVEAIDERFTAGVDSGASTLLMPGVSWDWRRSDDPIYPQRGWRLGLELKGASKLLLSDVDFLRAAVRSKGILPVRRGRLIGRAELGFSLVGEFDALPPSQRFFAGGDNSVRGYGYRDLAPRDVNGDVIGGRHLLTASLEYEHPLTTDWSLAAFADTGDAFDGTELRLHHAVGVGVRWRSPVGPIRVDLAHPLDQGADMIRIHFSLGPDL